MSVLLRRKHTDGLVMVDVDCVHVIGMRIGDGQRRPLPRALASAAALCGGPVAVKISRCWSSPDTQDESIVLLSRRHFLWRVPGGTHCGDRASRRWGTR